VIEEARRNHPYLESGGRHEPSLAFRGLDSIPGSLDGPLPEPPDQVAELDFAPGTLEAVRRFVARQGAAGGLGRNRSLDLVVAANEIASNSVKHGGGDGTLRIWTEPGRLLCEIHDRGGLDNPLSDRRLPGTDASGGRGLWLANQLCDLVQVRSGADGTTVRLHIVRS
jgi:anti-sigma regulatory factor (Ser/Thr protein kinase)